MSHTDGIADLRPLARPRSRRPGTGTDWANSAYVTTVSTVLFAPYIIAIAKDAAVDNRISLLGILVSPGVPAVVPRDRLDDHLRDACCR